MNGYVTEKLGNHIGFEHTRLLCQTRCMYFCLEYSNLFSDIGAYENAITLYKMIRKKYKNNSGWLQYPNHQQLTNLYEYSFLIFSISKLHSIRQKDEYKTELIHLHEIIQNKFYDIDNNFNNLKDDNGLISQNALMHLYEAYLELYKAIPSKEFTIILRDLLVSITFLFYDQKKNLISEYTFKPTSNKNIYEPGHTFEWCCLLNETKRLNIDINNILDEKNLCSGAEKYGIHLRNIVLTEINNTNNRYRIWPSLERIRYYGLTKNQKKLKSSYADFIDIFISKDTLLPIEYVNTQFTSEFIGVKTTTSYHLINSFKNLIGQV